MDVFDVFQWSIAVGSDRLETAHADALRLRSAGELWLFVGGFLTAHNGTFSQARRVISRLRRSSAGLCALQLDASVNQT